ncbi:hypothetical protein NL676_010793 [Syzygium grande]|nr:hypothetical protein NL676_010793 [Syzygium grande]
MVARGEGAERKSGGRSELWQAKLTDGGGDKLSQTRRGRRKWEDRFGGRASTSDVWWWWHGDVLTVSRWDKAVACAFDRNFGYDECGRPGLLAPCR